MTSPSLRRSLPPVYAAAALRLVFPALLLPLMALRLGAEDFGRLSLLLAWAALLSTLAEGGFLAAATRLAVRADAAQRWALAQQVFSARLWLNAAVLLLAVAAVGLLLQPATPALAVGWSLLLGLAACALGGPATWYLQASGQLHRFALIEIALYAGWALAVLALADSAAAYLLLQLLATAVLAVLGWAWLRRDLAPGQQARALFNAAAVRPGLRLGWTMLPVAVAGAAYSVALPAVAAAQMSRSELGLYFLADRLVRALLSAAEPVFQLVYPRIVQRFEHGARAALAYSGRWAAVGLLAGAAVLALGVLAWPLLRGMLAAHNAQALPLAALAPVLATLALLLPLLLGWKFIGYWMLGSGRFDTAYRAAVLVGGGAGVAGALAFGAQGAAVLARVALAVELLVIATAVAGIALTQWQRQWQRESQGRRR